MGSYLLRRLMLMGLPCSGMSVLIFIALRLVPGNIARYPGRLRRHRR